jgi:uncharacterized protein (TIGR02145 family)
LTFFIFLPKFTQLFLQRTKTGLMKIKIILSVVMLAVMTSANGQRPTYELTFTAVDSGSYVQLDSIKVMNRSQGGDTMIYWPDTTLSLEIFMGDRLLYVGYATFYPVGVSEVSNELSSFEVNQNYPNPMADRSEISMYIPQKGQVHVMITDMQGRVVLLSDRQLDEGNHSFRFHPGGGDLYFLTAYWNGVSRSIQMISTGQQDGRSCRLDYVGTQSGEPVLKNSLQVKDFIIRQSGLLDKPEGDTSYTFQFATNIPCLGMPTVEYEGQVYNTIQIFSQCWLKENLNVGTMIYGGQDQTYNSIKEKYCYDNNPDSCTKYGGLYQWKEMMQYTTLQGVQGICPPGWHIPTDEEWKVLEGAVDRRYGIGDPEWDISSDLRGLNAGRNLKSIGSWWYAGNEADLFGFSGLPGGHHDFHGYFVLVGLYGYWWSSTEDYFHNGWVRIISHDRPEVYLQTVSEESFGFSVRCLLDY